jgi:hypothetical protein
MSVSKRSAQACTQGWRVRLAGWVLSCEARRLWRADGQDVAINVWRSVTSVKSEGGAANE